MKGYHPVEPKLEDRLRLAYDLIPYGTGNILDLGGEISNIGWLPKHLLHKGSNVIILNIDIKSLKFGKNILPEQINYCQASVFALPFTDGAFDVVIMTDVLEHVKDESLALGEIFHILKPEGILVISVPHKGIFGFLDAMNIKYYIYPIYSFILKMANLLKREEIEIISRTSIVKHKHYSVKELSKMLDCRFKIEGIYLRGFFLYPFCNLIKDALDKLNWALPIQKLMRELMNLDYRINYRKMSYNVFVYCLRRP
jgi:2-polyprenyl-3-methyl-5-hydroxy-6-metoxy-1,4-benzoquinol methylase